MWSIDLLHCELINLLRALATFAACYRSCRNGGTCRGYYPSAYCDCPSGYTGSYCQNEGILYTHTILTCRQLNTVSLHIQWPVTQAVKMEEHVVLPLPLLTVCVPVGTQELTARTEVCMHELLRLSVWALISNLWIAVACRHPLVLHIYVAPLSWSSSPCAFLAVFTYCSADWECWHGGTCTNGKCICSEGTTGNHCESG